MLITKSYYKMKYVIGRAGIFDSIGNFNFLARMVLSNASKQLASAALQAVKLQQKISERKLLMSVK